MKNLHFVLIFFLISSLSSCQNNEVINAHRQSLKGSVSYHVTKNEVVNSELRTFEYDVMMHDGAYLESFPDDIIRYRCKDSIVVINLLFEEHATFYRHKFGERDEVDWYASFSNNLYGRRGEVVPSPFWEKRLYTNMEKTGDTLIDNKSYSIYHSGCSVVHHIDDKQAKYDYTYYVEKNSGLVTRIVATPTTNVDSTSFYQRVEYLFSDYSFADNQEKINKLISKDNPDYALFSINNKDNLPGSCVIFSDNKTQLTDAALDFPLVGLQRDTVTIRQMPGWVLLFSWTYGCPGCYKMVENTLTEKGDVLFENGITVLAANYGTSDVVKMEGKAKDCKRKFGFRCAKGLDSTLSMIPLPAVYLISPEKEIVFSSNVCIEDLDTLVALVKNHKPQLPAATQPIPLVEFVDNTFCFDTVASGSSNHCTFVLRNIGNAPLVIKGVASSCGCTTSSWDKRPILPGKESKIDVTFNPIAKGDFRKTIVVTTNAANKKRSILTITGVVQ